MTQDQPSRLDRIERILDQVAQQQLSNTAAIAHLTEQQAELKQELEDSINHLVGVIGDFVEQAHSSQEQAERDRQVFQAEIQRIWEYLLRQSGNGRSGG